MNITHDGEDVAGTFTLIGDASGAFQGRVDRDMFSGVLTSVFEGCAGTGNFSGTVSENRIEISVPEITTSAQGALFASRIRSS